jgi:hypothetical protein
MHAHMLWPLAARAAHDLAEPRFGVLKPPLAPRLRLGRSPNLGSARRGGLVRSDHADWIALDPSEWHAILPLRAKMDTLVSNKAGMSTRA